MSPIINLTGLSILFLMTGDPGQASPPALIVLKGTDLAGGAMDRFGSIHGGEFDVNTIYAETTEACSSMTAHFNLSAIPRQSLFLHLKGRDDDAPGVCAIAVLLNGQVVFEGPNGFSGTGWETRAFPIPPDALKAGENTLTIACREKAGQLGMPPWFQVARCVIGEKEFAIMRDPHKDFWVTLPSEKKPFPEPLPEGKGPGFEFRGTKGWMWTPEQTLAELPWLAAFKMNFFMNCYGSMCDIEHYAWGDPDCNRWWEDLPAEKKSAYEKIVRECQKLGINYCFSMNPNLCSRRFVNDGSPDSINQLYKHYEWMQGLGVKWFNVSLDDITAGIDAAGQAKVVNEIFHRLRAKDPEARMIFCPTYYWGDGTGEEQQPYLEILARELDKEVYFFWTGDAVVGAISREGADTFRRISGHRLFLWDNYPVNDGQPAMHLGPVIDRDPTLCEVVEGYMSNPHHTQNEINRIPLATCADYAWNPAAYDPFRSIGQAIFLLADTEPRREILKDLVETYPGMLIHGGGGTGYNAAWDQFNRIFIAPNSRQAALAYMEHLQRLSIRLKEEFPSAYQPEKDTLDNDIRRMETEFMRRYAGLE